MLRLSNGKGKCLVSGVLNLARPETFRIHCLKQNVLEEAVLAITFLMQLSTAHHKFVLGLLISAALAVKFLLPP